MRHCGATDTYKYGFVWSTLPYPSSNLTRTVEPNLITFSNNLAASLLAPLISLAAPAAPKITPAVRQNSHPVPSTLVSVQWYYTSDCSGADSKESDYDLIGYYSVSAGQPPYVKYYTGAGFSGPVAFYEAANPYDPNPSNIQTNIGDNPASPPPAVCIPWESNWNVVVVQGNSVVTHTTYV